MAGNPPASQGDGAGTGRSRPRARELNELIRYTMWSVFRVRDTGAIDAAAGPSGRAGLAAEVTELCQQHAGKGVTTRGCYDLQGLRADADYMFWWIASTPDDLQEIYARFRRTGLGQASEPVTAAHPISTGAAPGTPPNSVECRVCRLSTMV